MLKIWNFLNGKKRTIGIIIIFVAQAPHLIDLIGAQAVDILMYVGGGLAGVGALHAIAKGLTDKNLD